MKLSSDLKITQDRLKKSRKVKGERRSIMMLCFVSSEVKSGARLSFLSPCFMCHNATLLLGLSSSYFC